MNENLRALIERHLPNLKAQGLQLVMLLEQDQSDVEAARSLAHKIKGSSASLGFRELTDMCGEIETQCKSVMNGDEAPINPEFLGQLKAIVQHMNVSQSMLFEKAN